MMGRHEIIRECWGGWQVANQIVKVFETQVEMLGLLCEARGSYWKLLSKGVA